MAKSLRENPTGIFSLMLTPYNDDKTIDWATYEEYCDWQVEQGVEHLFVGTLYLIRIDGNSTSEFLCPYASP